MARAILRRQAVKDLNDIWKYTKNNWSERQADIYYRDIHFTIKRIEQTLVLENCIQASAKDFLG